jgi:hypothetical protein
MKTFGMLALAVGVVAATGGPVRAQQPGEYGPGRMLGSMVLIRIGSVHRELKATPEQVRKLDALFADFQKRGQAATAQLRDTPKDTPKKERNAKLLEMQQAAQESFYKGLAEALNPEQLKRLEQIEVQQGGVAAFQMPRVVQALKLTDDQKAQVRGINLEMRDSITSLSRTVVRSGDIRKDTENLVRQVFPLRAQALVKCIALLTDEQKTSWNDLNGEPFTVVVE